MLALYDVERHAHFVDITNDPKCDALIWAGYWRWALGYPDQARQAAEEQLALARRLAHPFNLCWSLTGGARAPLLRTPTMAIVKKTVKATKKHAAKKPTSKCATRGKCATKKPAAKKPAAKKPVAKKKK